MSSHNATGFWVVAALIAAMSVAVLIEMIIRSASSLVSQGMRRWRTATPPRQDGISALKRLR